jgi:hypothetical protein
MQVRGDGFLIPAVLGRAPSRPRPCGYPDKTIRLPSDASADELAALCRDYTARLYEWIEQVQSGAETFTRTQYDGTVRSLSRLYQEHPDSRFHEVKSNTRKFYVDILKIIERTVGARAVRNLTVYSVRHWYNQWKKPIEPGGKERADRAHDAVAMFRTILRFGAALRFEECRLLESELAMVKFDKGSGREQAMTYPCALAVISEAKELAANGVIPNWRARGDWSGRPKRSYAAAEGHYRPVGQAEAEQAECDLPGGRDVDWVLRVGKRPRMGVATPTAEFIVASSGPGLGRHIGDADAASFMSG